MSSYSSSFSSPLLIFFSIIATLAVALRIWARRIKEMKIELNDYFIVLALIFALVEVIVYIQSIPSLVLETEVNKVGLNGEEHGIVAYEISQASLLYFKLLFVSQLFWAITVAIIRSSIILLYIRLFPTPSFRRTCYGILTLNGAFSIAAMLADCVICIPIACLWNQTACNSCSSQALLSILSATVSLLLDITVVLLPMPVLWGLQMPIKKKLVISGMFGLGIIICTITAYRLQRATTIPPASKLYVNDTTIALGLLMCLEVILGVLNACLPVLKPVFDKTRGWKFDNIPISTLVQQMWPSRSERRKMEDWRTQNCIQFAPEPGKLARMKACEIHVRDDVHVESAPSEDRISLAG